MAGHHKWSKVKHPNGALDAKRGKLISQLAGEITLADNTGVGSPDGDPRLRRVLHRLRSVLPLAGAVSMINAANIGRGNDVKNVHSDADNLDDLLARIAGE